MAGRTVVVEQAAVNSPVNRDERERTASVTVGIIPVSDRLLANLYYGRFRRAVRGVLNRMLGDSSSIVRGPLKGCSLKSATPTYLLGLYELPVVYTMLDVLHEGDVVYDVGAHEGYFSLLAGRKVGSSGFVYAFEPLPDNARKVTAHLAENGIRQSHVVACAISDRAGAFPLSLSDAAATPSDAATPSLVRGAENAISVTAITLDDFVCQHRVPDLIKMDIEGAEVLALQGAAKLIRSDDAPRWIIEVHSAELHRTVIDLLTGAGYEIAVITPSHRRAAKAYPCHVVAAKDRARRGASRR
jgi:FkbM family methyltransferase